MLDRDDKLDNAIDDDLAQADEAMKNWCASLGLECYKIPEEPTDAK